MKKTSLFILLLSAQLSFGQAEKHIQVPGTKCSLIPPAGFIPSTTFAGFQDNQTGAAIMINEFPAPYQSIADGFTAEALKTQGLTVTNRQTIDFNNSQATLIDATQPANGTTFIKQILIFGDTLQTVLVNGIYPEASKAVEPEIKAALLSTVYNASQDDNPLDAVAFSIDVTNTEFKLVKYLSGSLIYSIDGKIPTDKPTLIVASSISKITAGNQRKYAEERLKKLPGGDLLAIREVEEVTIDNLKGYGITADAKTSDGIRELVYQVMLFNEKGDYYIVVGQTKEDFQEYLATFRQIAGTFKRK